MMTITYLLHEDRLYSCFISRLYAIYYTGKALIVSHDILTKIINIYKSLAHAIKTHFNLKQHTTASPERSDQTRRPSHYNYTQVKSHTHVNTHTHTHKHYKIVLYTIILYTSHVCACAQQEGVLCTPTVCMSAEHAVVVQVQVIIYQTFIPRRR